jgi:hypothetical protein
MVSVSGTWLAEPETLERNKPDSVAEQKVLSPARKVLTTASRLGIDAMMIGALQRGRKCSRF